MGGLRPPFIIIRPGAAPPRTWGRVPRPPRSPRYCLVLVVDGRRMRWYKRCAAALLVLLSPTNNKENKVVAGGI